MRRIEAQSHSGWDLQKELAPFFNKVIYRTMKTIISGGILGELIDVDPIPSTMPSTICLASTL